MRHDVTYPPLDTLKPVAENLWIVDSGPIHGAGLVVPVRMTVIRLASGAMWLHSPTRFEEGLKREIEALGPIRHLVAPNIVHWTFLKEWQRHCPEAETSAAPNLRQRAQVQAAGVKLDRDLGEAPPAEWAAEIDQTIVPGGVGFREVAFLHRATGTLILTDLIQNLEADKLPWRMRVFATLVGTRAPNGRAPVYLRLIVRLRRRDAREAVARLIAWGPERVIFTHGAWFAREGTSRLRRAFAWLVG